MALRARRITKEQVANRKRSTKNYLAYGRVAVDLQSMDASDKEKFILDFPDVNDVLHFSCTFHVDIPNSIWNGGVYKFDIEITKEYPIKPPKVTLNENYRVWHPNIDVNGNVCLNLLKKDWKPMCSITQVFFGLYFLFYEPNTSDPLNLVAADEMREDLNRFKQTVKTTLAGGVHKNTRYPNMTVKLREFNEHKLQLKNELNAVINKARN